MENADLGADDDLPRLRIPRVCAHSPSRQALVRSVAHLLGTFRMNKHRRTRMRSARGGDRLRRKPLVGGAVAGPEYVGLAALLGDVASEVAVRHEDYLATLRQRRHHLLGVAGRHAHVTLRLDLGRRVDVAYRERPRMLRLQGAKLLAGDHVRHGTSRRRVGYQHRLPWIQYRRRLGHEVDSAEHDDVRIDLRRPSRKFERVAGEVGDGLDLRTLVVVRKYHRVAFGLEPFDFVDCRFGHVCVLLWKCGLSPRRPKRSSSSMALRRRSRQCLQREACSSRQGLPS